TDPDVNNTRGDTPFGEVARPEQSFGPAAIGDNDRGQTVFEPRPERKGDVARTLMYMAARWGLGLAGEELVIARAWHAMDPVDEWERGRNDSTAQVQGNRNPFVDCPSLVQQVPDFDEFAPIQEQLP
ncbi:MAG: deoxyribonuclease-1, partial [Bradymonadia bacterium]